MLCREPLDMTLTVSGMALGTMRYMAPEQMDKRRRWTARGHLFSRRGLLRTPHRRTADGSFRIAVAEGVRRRAPRSHRPARLGAVARAALPASARSADRHRKHYRHPPARRSLHRTRAQRVGPSGWRASSLPLGKSACRLRLHRGHPRWIFAVTSTRPTTPADRDSGASGPHCFHASTQDRQSRRTTGCTTRRGPIGSASLARRQRQ